MSNFNTVLKKVIEFSTHPPSSALHSKEGVIEQSETEGEFKKKLAILILAAGPSSRLGQPKQQLLINGSPLLIRTVATALKANIGKVYVVIGYAEMAHRKLLNELPVEIVVNPDWKKGMGSSLKTGLSVILKTEPKIQATVILVCDQPLLTAEHLQLLATTFENTNQDIIASRYADTAGVPALFSKSLFPELLLIEDDAGAKKIIQHNLQKTSTIPFEGGAVDIDTQKDYEQLLKSRAE